MQLSKFEKNNLILAIKNSENLVKKWQESKEILPAQEIAKRILIVEDCLFQQAIAEILIQSALINKKLPPLSIAKEQTVKGALDVIRREKGNLKAIFLDLRLSDKCGLHLLREMKSDIRIVHKDTPVIVMSANKQNSEDVDFIKILAEIRTYNNVIHYIEKGVGDIYNNDSQQSLDLQQALMFSLAKKVN